MYLFFFSELLAYYTYNFRFPRMADIPRVQWLCCAVSELSRQYVNNIQHSIDTTDNLIKGSGGGDKFARTKGILGSLDWDDIHTMILEAIKLGLIDGKNLAITGYSMGGFLTTWGCTRPQNNEYTFKAGVCGAGPTSWGSFAESTDLSNLGVRCFAQVTLRALIVLV